MGATWFVGEPLLLLLPAWSRQVLSAAEYRDAERARRER